MWRRWAFRREKAVRTLQQRLTAQHVTGQPGDTASVCATDDASGTCSASARSRTAHCGISPAFSSVRTPALGQSVQVPALGLQDLAHFTTMVFQELED
jgi:hypothetical protein